MIIGIGAHKATLNILFGRRARSDKGLFALVGGKKIKNEITFLACIRGKNKKDALQLVFYHENRQSPHELSAFLIIISLIFLHVGGKNKKKT